MLPPHHTIVVDDPNHQIDFDFLHTLSRAVQDVFREREIASPDDPFVRQYLATFIGTVLSTYSEKEQDEFIALVGKTAARSFDLGRIEHAD
jgi:hypothetical protein